MIRQAVTVAMFAAATSSSFAQTWLVNWDLETVPITVEVVQDVPVSRSACGERGVLCATAEFVIPRGGRFRMLEIGSEGACTIEYQQSRYEVSSCPWVSASQAEIFVVVEVDARELSRKCVERGGIMKGTLGAQWCAFVYRDGGQACNDSSECEGSCVLAPGRQVEELPILGVCEAESAGPSCTTFVTNGRFGGTFCP